MKPVDQTKLHNPPINGNCLNACFASILEINIEDIPCFEDMGAKWYPVLLKWLKSLGFCLIRWDSEIYLPSYFIASGMSPRGNLHAVVYKDTEMVHDPHPSRSGIKKIDSVWALLPLDPSLHKRKL